MAAPALRWLVVGGGPCGIMATGLLVDHERIRSSSGNCAAGAAAAAVGWVDPSFSVGRLARYGLVPSNTSLEGTSISRRVVASLNCAYWPWRTPLRPLALPQVQPAV